MGLQPGDGLALVTDLALTGPHEAHDGLERRALAHPVATEEAHHLTGAHLQRHPVEDVALAVEGMDTLDGDEGGRGRRGRAAHVLRYTSSTFGLRWISAGVPSASTSPEGSTVIRWARSLTACMSCSAIMG